MEPIVSMIQETGHHAAKQRTVLVARTRDASAAFVEETRGVGRDLVRFVQVEARRWKRYLRLRVGAAQKGARDALTPAGLERRVLVGVDGTLRALDAQVRMRLALLEKRSAKKSASRRVRALPRRKSNGTAALAAH